MSDEQIYAIKDIKNYAEEMRKASALSISKNSLEDNLDDYISINQMIELVNSNCLGFDEQSRPLLNEKTNKKIFEEAAIWIHNVGLAKLAAKNLIECAWDEEVEDMVFWVKES